MRRSLALGAVAAIAIGAASGADSGTSTTVYLRASASGYFYYGIDYGSDPRSTFNDFYGFDIDYTVNAIAIYDGRSVTVPRGLMLVAGTVHVLDKRTQLSGGRQVPSRCGKPGSENGRDEYWEKITKARFANGSIFGNEKTIDVDPAQAIDWNIGCSATEALPSHGLPGGPGFSVPTPARSRFTGKESFSIGCKDEYIHDFDPPGLPNTHSFEGLVRFSLKFTPFPASKLSATKKLLRDRVGKSLPATVPKAYKDCV